MRNRDREYADLGVTSECLDFFREIREVDSLFTPMNAGIHTLVLEQRFVLYQRRYSITNGGNNKTLQ